MVLEFGETVQFIPFRTEARADKFDAKVREGVWLGLDNRTDDNIIGSVTECIGRRPSKDYWRTKDGTKLMFLQCLDCRGTPRPTSTLKTAKRWRKPIKVAKKGTNFR